MFKPSGKISITVDSIIWNLPDRVLSAIAVGDFQLAAPTYEQFRFAETPLRLTMSVQAFGQLHGCLELVQDTPSPQGWQEADRRSLYAQWVERFAGGLTPLEFRAYELAREALARKRAMRRW